MLRRLVLGGLGGLLLASLAWARQGTVKTINSQIFEGDITEQDDKIFVSYRGIRSAIDRHDIRSITYADTIADEARRRRARLTAYDVPGRIELAKWLFENKAYSLARTVLDEARQIQPRSSDVADMIQTVDRQIELEEHEARKHAPVELAAADNNPRSAAPPAAERPAAPANRLLTPDEINLIRQDEWQEGQTIRARFENDVRRRYVAREQLDPGVFNRLPPVRQAWAIIQQDIQQNTDALRKDVILSDPPAMTQFRQIQRSLLAECGRCHTPAKAPGNFVLHFPAENDAATYTNFLILQKYSHKEGNKAYAMIDRLQPPNSLLLKFALPPNRDLDASHPDADNYHGVIRNPNDMRLRKAADWIASLNPTVPSDYNDIDLGGGNPTSKPSVPPASKK